MLTSDNQIPSLKDLEFIPYLDETGNLPEYLQKKIGVYAIFDQDKTLRFLNYSRDVYISIKQHLVRQPHSCYWLKIETIEKPNRSRLETIRKAWIEENGVIPVGNGEQENLWSQPIDAKVTMTEAEQLDYEQSEELAKTKILKKIARRVEAKIKDELESRGVKTEIRFNPKLKEKGLLDIK
ncbi:MAG: GIY-YIG nuclease family protein [Moorea sp. SIO1F2]|uniref:GIY-YIG nuclease family protein n=1 Tax=Moorena sp. SIO1F2 TaxID=2607819 RepID=UPI0013BCC7AC|nr:GIY-YIG nuclease family protein [Moorena sp. SIO1F2]NET83620.1 GIY-YIG nuclease family protein [Moorena sp. SIO1F2]